MRRKLGFRVHRAHSLRFGAYVAHTELITAHAPYKPRVPVSQFGKAMKKRESVHYPRAQTSTKINYVAPIHNWRGRNGQYWPSYTNQYHFRTLSAPDDEPYSTDAGMSTPSGVVPYRPAQLYWTDGLAQMSSFHWLRHQAIRGMQTRSPTASELQYLVKE
jgi:hypothetical protein